MTTLIELKYYQYNGEFVGATSFMSQHRDVGSVANHLRELNREGRMPGATGPISGFVSFDITSKRKESEFLLKL